MEQIIQSGIKTASQYVCFFSWFRNIIRAPSQRNEGLPKKQQLIIFENRTQM